MYDQNPNTSENQSAPESLEQQVAAWRKTESDIRAAVASTEGISIAGHTEGPKKGREAVHKALMTLVNLRTNIEARRKELKSPILALGNLVDSEAKRLSAISATREAELKADRDAYDAEQARIAAEIEAERKRQEAAAEAERQRILTLKIQRIVNLGFAPDVVAISAATEEEFEEMVAAARAAKEEREAREAEEILQRQIAQANKEREERERKAEEDRIRAERQAEEDRLRAEREAAEKKASEERAARDAIVRSRSAQAVAVGWAIDAHWLETATEDEFQAHLESAKADKVRRDEEAANMERRRKELAEAEAKLKAEQDALEEAKAIEAKRIADEEAAQAEAERKAREDEAEKEMAALLAAKAECERPDREKAIQWIKGIEWDAMVSPLFVEQSVRELVESRMTLVLETLQSILRDLEAV